MDNTHEKQLKMSIIFTKKKSSAMPSLVAVILVILLAAAAVSGKTHMQEGSFRVASTFYEKTDKKGRVRRKATDKPFFTRLSTKPGFYRVRELYYGLGSGLTLEGGTPGAKIRSETLAEINVITDASGEGLKIRRYQREIRNFSIEIVARSCRPERLRVLAYL
ncbi:hypothetical protein LguiB_030809 [Lonicera macranthoides]